MKIRKMDRQGNKTRRFNLEDIHLSHEVTEDFRMTQETNTLHLQLNISDLLFPLSK